MAWATTAQKANEGERAQTDWGTNPELPAYKGSFAGDVTRPGWDDLADDVEEFARRAMQQRAAFIVPGYLNGLRPYISGGKLYLDTGAAVVDGWWCPNLTAAVQVLPDNGTSYVYVGVTAGGVPAPDTILVADYGSLADIAPACLICEVVQTAGTVTSIKDLRHLAMLTRGDDLWPALRMMATQSGAEGIYSGGADDIGDFSSGKYPAASMIVFDDHGGAVPARWTQAVAVGKANLAASGTYNLYAVVNVGDNEPQDPAQTGWVPLLIEAYDNGKAAPPNSFLLGSGSYTGTTLSNFTIDANARVKSQFFTDGGGDHLLTVTRADLAADRTYTIPDAGAAADFVMTAGAQTVAGVKTFSSTPVVPNDSFTYAKLQNVSATDKLLGRSTAGAGDIEEIACTAAARSILDDATVSAIIATLFGSYVVETDYFSSSTITGWAASPTGVIYYSRLGNVVTVNFYITGTSNNEAASFTLPYQLKTGITTLSVAIRVIDSGASQADAGHCYMTSGSALVTMRKTLTGTGFTASGTKTVSGQFRYFCNA